ILVPSCVETDSVKQFTSELIVEAVVRCIRVIEPGLGGALPTSLPPGMSARFRVGMSLAQACQDLGYKGDIGYQTFLYSNEPEIRSLLMFLVEKLPRESAESSDQPTGKSVVLQRSIAAALRAQLAVPWLPPACRLPLQTQTQSLGSMHSFQVQPLSLPLGPPVEEYRRDVLRPVTAQLSSHCTTAASLLERHTAELSAAHEWDVEWKSQGLLSRLTPQEYRSRKLSRLRKRIEEQLRSATLPAADGAAAGPASSSSSADLSDLLQSFRSSSASDRLLTKGTHFTHTQKFTFAQVRPPPRHAVTRPAGDAAQRRQDELDVLQQQGDAQEGGRPGNENVWESELLSLQVKDELKQRERGNAEEEDRIHVKKKTIDLLPDADDNLLQLQAVMEASSQRLVHLAAQWEKHRTPLIEEHRRLKEIRSSQDLESSRKLSEIKSLHDKIRVSTEESRKKEETYKQLVSELDSLPQDASRSAYTQRILEIVSNIKKQKEEITKILTDTKDLQKEINSLTGKLDRTFAVTDELVFKDAKKDESVRKSYKYLAALHENCNQLIQTIEDTGTILREIRDLEEQIETENSNKTMANLERILEDYKAIRQENAALAAKVREG
uniref:Coiled-coil domain-containing protein 22 n=1 Tax=Salarias fasciatus TaxID=181472 RepID=A0A672FD34_SALFA